MIPWIAAFKEPGTVEPPGEPGTNEERGTQPGTRNPEPGTQNRSQQARYRG